MCNKEHKCFIFPAGGALFLGREFCGCRGNIVAAKDLTCTPERPPSCHIVVLLLGEAKTNDWPLSSIRTWEQDTIFFDNRALLPGGLCLYMLMKTNIGQLYPSE
ncbi:hypothetical protein HHUSO_G7076 [Huso huso]|uniref:Uncharacterized protein n=1 Tax=Huso huso TaxID=61971 RepID=A0ABR0ZZ43_HUSHU